MRYEELHGPLEGWTYDERGTIYTPSGYRCSAQLIEVALWLFQAHQLSTGKRPIYSDESVGARRQMFEPFDLRESGSAREEAGYKNRRTDPQR